MTGSEHLFDELDGLLDLLAVGSIASDRIAREKFYHEMAIDRAHELLRWNSDTTAQTLFETRLRLAMHLSPRNAIHYRRSNPRPRWRLIFSHLVEAFGREPRSAERLSREIAQVLDNWDSDRLMVTGHLHYLINRDGARCRNCGVNFGQDSITLRHSDEYKPYFLSPDQLLRPEVDHIEAISALGTNVLSNLQVLCRLCNEGKGVGLGLPVKDEIDYGGLDVRDVPRSYRFKLVYYVIQRDSCRCSQCGEATSELTIRPVLESGGLVRSNLRAVCVDCLY